VKTVGTQTASSIDSPTNHRNNRLYWSCSISSRSLRIEYSACSSSARSNCSGGIDGRPIDEYIASKRVESACKATSVICRINRSRVLRRDPSVGRDVIEEMTGLLIVTAHARHRSTLAAGCRSPEHGPCSAAG